MVPKQARSWSRISIQEPMLSTAMTVIYRHSLSWATSSISSPLTKAPMKNYGEQMVLRVAHTWSRTSCPDMVAVRLDPSERGKVLIILPWQSWAIISTSMPTMEPTDKNCGRAMVPKQARSWSRTSAPVRIVTAVQGYLA